MKQKEMKEIANIRTEQELWKCVNKGKKVEWKAITDE